MTPFFASPSPSPSMSPSYSATTRRKKRRRLPRLRPALSSMRCPISLLFLTLASATTIAVVLGSARPYSDLRLGFGAPMSSSFVPLPPPSSLCTSLRSRLVRRPIAAAGTAGASTAATEARRPVPSFHAARRRRSCGALNAAAAVESNEEEEGVERRPNDSEELLGLLDRSVLLYASSYTGVANSNGEEETERRRSDAYALAEDAAYSLGRRLRGMDDDGGSDDVGDEGESKEEEDDADEAAESIDLLVEAASALDDAVVQLGLSGANEVERRAAEYYRLLGKASSVLMASSSAFSSVTAPAAAARMQRMEPSRSAEELRDRLVRLEAEILGREWTPSFPAPQTSLHRSSGEGASSEAITGGADSPVSLDPSTANGSHDGEVATSSADASFADTAQQDDGADGESAGEDRRVSVEKEDDVAAKEDEEKQHWEGVVSASSVSVSTDVINDDDAAAATATTSSSAEEIEADRDGDGNDSENKIEGPTPPPLPETVVEEKRPLGFNFGWACA